MMSSMLGFETGFVMDDRKWIEVVICSLYKAGEQEEFCNINRRRKCPFYLLLRNQKYDHMGSTGCPMFLLELSHLNTDDKGFTPMQKHWVPLQQTVTPLVICKDLLTGTWKGIDVLSSWEEDMHVFFQRMQKLDHRQTYSTLPPKNKPNHNKAKQKTNNKQSTSIVNPEKKEAKEGKRNNIEHKYGCSLYSTYF